MKEKNQTADAFIKRLSAAAEGMTNTSNELYVITDETRVGLILILSTLDDEVANQRTEAERLRELLARADDTIMQMMSAAEMYKASGRVEQDEVVFPPFSEELRERRRPPPEEHVDMADKPMTMQEILNKLLAEEKALHDNTRTKR